MRRLIILCTVLGFGLTTCAVSLAQGGLRQPVLIAPATYNNSYTRQDAEPSPSDQPASRVPVAARDMSSRSTTCCEEPSCGCETGCCDGCGSGGGLGGLCDCCLGDPCTLKEYLTPCCDINYGGWVQIGYHSDNERLSANPGDLFAFNDYPDHLNLHQAWLYVEKVAEADCCSAGWGYRFDILYGTDAQKTQAFGNDDNTWDNSLDHGVYGWAIPQLYAEVAYGDWRVKIGHFFTLVGYEVVPATGNFFYSHSLTLFNSEPFTHTGVLGEYALSDDTTIHLGWVLGWDTGFDQFDGSSAAHAGFIHQATDDVSVSYMMTGGDLGWRGEGYSHSVVVDVTLSECVNYVLQSDYVNTEFPDGFDNEDIGVNQYLFYTVNDCLALGTRMEWWKSNNVTGVSDSFQEITGGVNYRPHANVVIRPEIRYDWTNESAGAGTLGYNQTVFGIDAIFTY